MINKVVNFLIGVFLINFSWQVVAQNNQKDLIRKVAGTYVYSINQKDNCKFILRVDKSGDFTLQIHRKDKVEVSHEDKAHLYVLEDKNKIHLITENLTAFYADNAFTLLDFENIAWMKGNFAICTMGDNDKRNKLPKLLKIIQKENLALIDGIDVDKNIFKYSNLPNIKDLLGRFYYENDTLAEDLLISDLLNPDYQAYYLFGSDDFEVFYDGIEDYTGDISKKLFLNMLLTVRLEQLKDSDAFYLLTKYAREELRLEAKGELRPKFLQYSLFLLFLQDPLFFVQQANKYQDASLIKYLKSELDKYLVKELFFSLYKAQASLKPGNLYLLPMRKILRYENRDPKLRGMVEASVFIKDTIDMHPKFPGWWERELALVAMYAHLQREALDKLTEDEKNFYDKNIRPLFNDYVMRNYHVKSDYGFVNLSSKPSVDSEIITKIDVGEYVCFIEEAGDWVRVYYPKINAEFNLLDKGYVHNPKVDDLDVITGYIHKSQLEKKIGQSKKPVPISPENIRRENIMRENIKYENEINSTNADLKQ